MHCKECTGSGTQISSQLRTFRLLAKAYHLYSTQLGCGNPRDLPIASQVQEHATTGAWPLVRRDKRLCCVGSIKHKLACLSRAQVGGGVNGIFSLEVDLLPHSQSLDRDVEVECSPVFR